MRTLRPRLTGAELAAPLLGGAATVFAAYMSVRMGAGISVGLLLTVTLFAAAVIGFLTYPHLAVAATIVLFALVPTLKVFVSPEIGAVKDLVVLAAVSAGVLLLAFERRQPDRWVLMLVLLLLGLYVVNAGGGHDIAWLQGVRLVGEPLLLLLVGLMLPQPQRTFRFALVALIATCCLVAAYGIGQQFVGKYTLVEWGYSFDQQVRSFSGGELRSFGTLDDPFAYAALLCLGLAGVFFWLRRGPLAWSAALLILLGLGASFVRAAILVLIGFVGLALRRWGYTTSAVTVVAATLIAGGVILVHAGGTETRLAPVGGGGAGGSVNVALNGRISAWETALGDEPVKWVVGRGVGEVGTAAARANYELAPSDETPTESQAVDSGYLATIADVGLVGLAVLLALFARLFVLATDAAQRTTAGWVALALLAVLVLDALTRASFTGFPTAFLGLFLIGIAIAAAQEETEETASSSRPLATTGG